MRCGQRQSGAHASRRDAGFALELQSVSGGLDCAVPVTVQGKRYVYGDGACRIDCNMVSGGVEVRLPDA